MNILLHKRTLFITLLLPQLLFCSEKKEKRPEKNGYKKVELAEVTHNAISVRSTEESVQTGTAQSVKASSKRSDHCRCVAGGLLLVAFTAGMWFHGFTIGKSVC